MDLLVRHGLSESDAGVAEHLVLDLLLTYNDAHPGTGPKLQELAEASGRSGDLPLLKANAELIIDGLERREAIRLARGITGPMGDGLGLTSNGRGQALHARRQRGDRAARSAACRHALLRWLYNGDYDGGQINLGRFFGHPLAFFWGYPFEMDDLDRAASWLDEKGLIEAMRPWGYTSYTYTARITNAGIDCVEQCEGDLATYLSRSIMSGGTNINIHGDNSGQIGVAGHGNVTQTQQGPDVERLLGVLNGVRNALPTLSLNDVDTSELTQTMDQIEAKGTAGTLTSTEKKSLLARVGELIAKSASALAPALVSAIENLMN